MRIVEFILAILGAFLLASGLSFFSLCVIHCVRVLKEKAESYRTVKEICLLIIAVIISLAVGIAMGLIAFKLIDIAIVMRGVI